LALHSTKDIWVASWLELEKQIKFDSYKINEQRKVVFYYKIPQEEWSIMMREYFYSKFLEIKAKHDQYKELRYYS